MKNQTHPKFGNNRNYTIPDFDKWMFLQSHQKVLPRRH